MFAVKRDPFLPWPGVHRLLVDVMLPDVDVGLTLELANLDKLHVSEGPGGLATGVPGYGTGSATTVAAALAPATRSTAFA